MTLVVIGPVTNDLVVIGKESSNKVGGATYFQSFVFDVTDNHPVPNSFDAFVLTGGEVLILFY